ncbi:MAG TPA: helix-turn-helix domain-containing protein [Burkholderiaceae bacterium]
MKMEDVADELAVKQAQVYALVRNGSLPAIKVGGRGQWRIERSRLETFIADAYTQTAQFVADNPFGRDNDDDADVADPETPEEPPV